ncbi:MAG: EAL domain-containing protein [Gammaproteobacteria bacterium]
MGKHVAGATVLAVDDNATIRKAIAMRLGAKGFDVVTAVDGQDALNRIGHGHFDLVILDLQMPGLRGEDVLRQIRARYTATQLPVIVLAASSDKTDINRSLDLGANDYIIKPGDLPILVARIRTQLALKDTVARLRLQSALMRDMLSLEPAGASSHRAQAEARPKSVFPLDTEAFLEQIEHGHSVPFDVLHDNTPMTCFALRDDGTVMHANRFGARYLGFRPDELVDRPMLDLYVGEDRALAEENLNGAIEQPGQVHRWDIRHIKNNGDVIWMRDTARAVTRGDTTFVLLTCEDIDDTYKLSELLAFQSQHDELTGLVNRKALERRLAQVIESAQAEHADHALAIIDLDQFKLVNDNYGPDAGDELLRQVAQILKGVARKRDTIARVGGDEFAVLLEDCPLTAAHAASDALRRAIEDFDFNLDGRRYKVSASIGIVPINEFCDSPGNALSMADTACYAAKESGRNRIHVYEPDSISVVARRGEMRWAARLNTALIENRFTLCFQPISPLAEDGPEGMHYEILLRMIDEEGAQVMPGQFLPAAERYNLSDRLDRWVIGNLFDWLEQRPQQVSAMGLCSINLSGQSIGNEELLGFIFEQLRRGVIAPEKVCFEITETAAIADLMQANLFIHQLKEYGCRFALDDFGSGFSSLAYLKQLPVDFLKIDGAFVRDMVSDAMDFAMVRSINDIGHVMGKQTIAEFVENEATLELLRSLGVDFAQGYQIGRPIPIADFRLEDWQ